MPNPQLYLTPDGIWSILDLAASVSVPGYAFAQVQDSTPPTFVSSILNYTSGALEITFSEDIDVTPATNVVPAKMHVRESGNYTGGGITLSAVELATTVDGATISFALNASRLAAVAELAVPELTIEPGAVQDTSGDLIEGTFDASTAVFVDATLISQETGPTDMAFSNDGTKMFVVGTASNEVNEYALSAAFDASTRNYTDAFTGLINQDNNPRSMAFSNDGTRMFIVGLEHGANLYEYTLSPAFDASTAVLANTTTISEETAPSGIAFSNDGTKMFVIGSTGNDVNEYTLTIPFNATTRTFVDDTSISFSGIIPADMAFSNDGAKMFVLARIGFSAAEVHEYTLSPHFDASNATFIDATSVLAQEASPRGMAFSNDGSKMFVIGSTGDDINEYALSSVYPITVVASAPPPDAFVTTWETTGAGQTVTIPATGTYSIDWGDGTANATASGTQTHNYASAGSHTVAITGGLEGISINSLPSQAEKNKLRSIDQWGNITWTTMQGAFRGASNMAYDAADTPDLSGVASMNTMFRDTSFSANLSGWNVSSVTDTSRMFQGSSFNGDISGWDVSRVQNMRSMFSGASSFNQPLDTWNVSSATNMAYMFYDADRFNQDLDTWTVSSVETMEDMFGSSDVNSAFNGNISTWDVSQVQVMQNMFNRASSFDQPLNDWDVSRVQSMRSMFSGASSFNQPLNDWNVSSATDMDFMFFQANDFDQNLGTWYVVPADTFYDHATEMSLNVTTMSAQNPELDAHAPNYDIGAGGDFGLFNMTGSTLFFKSAPTADRVYKVNVTAPGGDFGRGNHIILDITVTGTPPPVDSAAFVTTWETTSAGESITIPVRNAAGNYTVHWGDGSTTTHVADAVHAYAEAGNHTVSISGNFTQIRLAGDTENAAKLQSIDQWGNIAWTTMKGAFEVAVNMTYNAADAPDLSAVTNMDYMFYEAASFDGNLSGWDVSSATDMTSMFDTASSFDGDISGWDVSSVTGMRDMFRDASSFDGDISGWNVSSVTDMRYMFYDAASFDGNLSGWDVSSATDMTSVFYGATSFNQTLSGWNVSHVTGMSGMFRNADSFDQPLDDWNVSSVTNMIGMFRGADSFDQPLDDWDVSSVTDMEGMFRGADSFDQPLSGWNVSSVTNMIEMFQDATSFNQTLSGWNVSSVTDMDSMFYGAASFNQDISGWDVSSVRFMHDMFADAAKFDQNLGEWYVVLNSTEIDASGAPGMVGAISAQNSFLGNQATYGIGTGGDPGSFNITGGSNLFMNISSPAKSTYTVNITSDGGFSTPNHRVYDVTVTGIVVTNNSPDADAGSGQTVNEGATVTLDGSGSSDPDGDPLSYSWESDGTPQITLAGQAPTFTAPQVGTSGGTVVFTLTVDDGNGGTDTDTVAITVNDVVVNQPPTADAGSGQTVNEGATVTLDGSGSSDPDNDPLSYSWESDGTPQITLAGQAPTFTAPQVGTSGGTVVFTLTVSDGNGGTDTDTVTITINNVVANQPPTADAGSGQTVNEGATVTLDGSGSSDPDNDPLSYSWESDGTPQITLAGQAPTFTAPQVGTSGGTVVFTLTVSDGNGGTDTDTVTITVQDVPPPPGTFDAVITPQTSSPTNQDPVFDVTFGSAVLTGEFTPSDVSASPAGLDVSVSGSGTAFSITISNAPDGMITVQIPADAVSDADRDTNAASNRASVTVDKTVPQITSARVSGTDTITVSFSEGVQGTTGVSDWSLQGAPGVTVDSAAGLPGSSVSLGLSGDLPEDRPELTLGYSGSGIQDAAGNPLGTANSITVSYPSSGRSQGSQAPPVIDIGSVTKSYPQSVPEWVSLAAAGARDPGTPIPPIGVNGTFAFPLEMGSNGYLLDGPVNTLVPHAIPAGQTVTIKMTVHDPTPIAYFAAYLNLPGDSISHLDSDAQVIWNNGQTYVVDRSGLMRDAAITMSGDPDDASKKTFTVTVTLSEEMGESNMAIRTWNAAGHLTEVQIFDALDVRAPEPEPAAVDPEPAEAEPEPAAVDPEPAAVDGSAGRDLLAIRMWSGFEPESISDAQLLASLGLDYPGADIPSWVMTELGPLAAKGDITIGEFKTALQYVLDNA